MQRKPLSPILFLGQNLPSDISKAENTMHDKHLSPGLESWLKSVLRATSKLQAGFGYVRSIDSIRDHDEDVGGDRLYWRASVIATTGRDQLRIP
jgi:hypothetical protein